MMAGTIIYRVESGDITAGDWLDPDDTSTVVVVYEGPSVWVDSTKPEDIQKVLEATKQPCDEETELEFERKIERPEFEAELDFPNPDSDGSRWPIIPRARAPPYLVSFFYL